MNPLLKAAMSIVGFGQKEGCIFMRIKSLLNWLAQTLSAFLWLISFLGAFMCLPAYILGFVLKQGNLLQIISWPSLLAILLCGVCIRGKCAYPKSFAWQFVYFLLLSCSFGVIEFHYVSEAESEALKAFFWMLVIVFGAMLLAMDIVKLRRGEKSPSEDEKFNSNVWEMLSYPIFFFLFSGLADVIPGMDSLIKNADIGKEMMALLVVSCPLAILNVFWDSIKKDDNAETERKLDDLLSKVQNVNDLASSLKDSQNRIEERVQNIDEKISRTADDKPGISLRKSNSTYELKITMRRRH